MGPTNSSILVQFILTSSWALHVGIDQKHNLINKHTALLELAIAWPTMPTIKGVKLLVVLLVLTRSYFSLVLVRPSAHTHWTDLVLGVGPQQTV